MHMPKPVNVDSVANPISRPSGEFTTTHYPLSLSPFYYCVSDAKTITTLKFRKNVVSTYRRVNTSNTSFGPRMCYQKEDPVECLEELWEVLSENPPKLDMLN